MPQDTPDTPPPQGAANDDNRELLGTINKRDNYILPENGWSSLGPRALDYLRDPRNIAPKSLRELVNRFLRRLHGYTRSEDPRVLASLIEAFGTLEIDIGDEMFALYPYTPGGRIKTFQVYFRTRREMSTPNEATPSQAA